MDASASDMKKSIFAFFACIGLFTLLATIGGLLISFSTQTAGSEKIIDYTNCTHFNGEKCSLSVRPHKTCDCYINFNLLEPILGEVTMFYYLPDYDKIIAAYGDSKDDAQLAGQLSPKLSMKCGNYSYVDTGEEKRPIAPCGALADHMFLDSFMLSFNLTTVPGFDTGLQGITEDDKNRYRNPPGEDLEAAFKYFAKPTSWSRNIWELDRHNADNNGFQNERFIAWMKADLKYKPVIRFNHTGEYEHGLPAGNYTLRARYASPTSTYDGPRKVILTSLHTVTNSSHRNWGITLLVLAIIILIGFCIYIINIFGLKKKYSFSVM